MKYDGSEKMNFDFLPTLFIAFGIFWYFVSAYYSSSSSFMNSNWKLLKVRKTRYKKLLLIFFSCSMQFRFSFAPSNVMNNCYRFSLCHLSQSANQPTESKNNWCLLEIFLFMLQFYKKNFNLSMVGFSCIQ